MGAFDSQELSLFRDSVDRYVSDTFDLPRLCASMAELGGDRASWQALAELGWQALPLPADHGGLDGGLTEVCVVMEAIGRGLMLEPYLATVILGAGLIAAAGTDEQRATILPSIAGGEETLAVAWQEPGSGYALTMPETRCAGGVLTGVKTAVFQGDLADRLVVLAADEAGQARLYLTAASGEGMTVDRHATIDGRSAVHVTYDGTPAEPLADVDALPIVERILDRATIAVCAEAVGAIGALNRTLLDYVKQRHQFGVAIGSFQVLQHRLVDMAIAEQESSAITAAAAAALDAGRADASTLVSAAKVRVGEACRFVGEAAIQTHGGMGMVDEHVAGHLFKRLLMLGSLFGDSDCHIDRLAGQFH